MFVGVDDEADALVPPELEAVSEVDETAESDAEDSMIFVGCTPLLQIGIFLT